MERDDNGDGTLNTGAGDLDDDQTFNTANAQHHPRLGQAREQFPVERLPEPSLLTLVAHEYTRECVALEANRGMTVAGVAGVLIDLFASRGVPTHIRSDNGGEFIAIEDIMKPGP